MTKQRIAKTWKALKQSISPWQIDYEGICHFKTEHHNEKDYQMQFRKRGKWLLSLTIEKKPRLSLLEFVSGIY
jgi:hypothetical protein